MSQGVGVTACVVARIVAEDQEHPSCLQATHTPRDTTIILPEGLRQERVYFELALVTTLMGNPFLARPILRACFVCTPAVCVDVLPGSA